MWRGWLDFVREKGGCRGRELHWDAGEGGAAEGGYDAQTRTRAEAEAREMIERIRAQYLPNLAPFDEGEDSDSDSDSDSNSDWADPREWPAREAEMI